jgi:6-pyruvoyl-tetrahydropterin synthase
MTNLITLRMREEGFTFDATHTIPSFPPGDRDRAVHQHLFSVAVEVSVKVDPERGYAFDHRVIEEGVNDSVGVLAGKHINEMHGLERGLVEDILLVHFVPRLVNYFAKRSATLQLVELRQVGLGPSAGFMFDTLAPSLRSGRDHVKIWRADENPSGVGA